MKGAMSAFSLVNKLQHEYWTAYIINAGDHPLTVVPFHPLFQPLPLFFPRPCGSSTVPVRTPALHFQHDDTILKIFQALAVNHWKVSGNPYPHAGNEFFRPSIVRACLAVPGKGLA